MPYKLATESLLKPQPQQRDADRRVWSIPLNTVWVPYFTAMKVAGKVDIADESLGAPLRLAMLCVSRSGGLSSEASARMYALSQKVTAPDGLALSAFALAKESAVTI